MTYLNSPKRTPPICPVCGEDVPPKSLACPECGADHQTGWAPNALALDGLDLPDDQDEFDYDEFIQQEFGKSVIQKPKHLHRGWWIAGLILLIAFASLFLLSPLTQILRSVMP